MNQYPFEFSDDAIKKIGDLQTSEEYKKFSAVRLYVEGKHCDGFSYGLCFDDYVEDQDNMWPLTDQTNIIIDKKSYQFMEGCQISWNDNHLGAGFIIENPNQREFRGKFYKRSKWQEKLEK